MKAMSTVTSRILGSALLVTLTVAGVVLVPMTARSHCEIPCGIYGDMARVKMIREHVGTIEKSMGQIQALGDGSNHNQLVRWVNNKESHATEIQHIVSQYIMTQRIKAKDASDAEGHKKYIAQLTAAHGMLVSAMKCKQTTDAAHCKKLLSHLDAFSAAYFSKEDLEHLKGH